MTTKRTMKSRPSISKSSFSCMLGRRGRESRKPIWSENQTHLITSLWPAPVLLMAWTEPQGQHSGRISIRQHDHFADMFSSCVDKPGGCKWRSRRKCEHPAAPVLSWLHQSKNRTDPSSSSFLAQRGIITDVANCKSTPAQNVSMQEKSYHHALTLINFRVNIWFDGKSVLNQAGFKIHLQCPNQKLRGINCSICVQWTRRHASHYSVDEGSDVGEVVREPFTDVPKELNGLRQPAHCVPDTHRTANRLSQTQNTFCEHG